MIEFFFFTSDAIVAIDLLKMINITVHVKKNYLKNLDGFYSGEVWRLSWWQWFASLAHFFLNITFPHTEG